MNVPMTLLQIFRSDSRRVDFMTLKSYGHAGYFAVEQAKYKPYEFNVEGTPCLRVPIVLNFRGLPYRLPPTLLSLSV